MNLQELIGLAESSFRERRTAEAADYCAQALQIDPNNRPALHLLARVRSLNGDLDEALVLLEKAIHAEPKFAPTHNDFGAIQLLANHPELALPPLRRAVELAPSFADAHINLGNAMQNLGRYAEAEKSYRLGVKLAPDHARGWTSLGNLLRTLRNFEESAGCFEKARALQPENPIIRNFLGVAYRHLGKRKRAMQQFSRALELGPDLCEANFNYGGALMGQRRFREAIPYLKKGGNMRSIGNAVQCLLELGAYDELFEDIASLAGEAQVNLYVAALSAYASDCLGRVDPYPFCPEPLSFVRIVAGEGGSKIDADLREKLIEECTQREALWEPIGISTRKGFQTPTSLLQETTGPLGRLKTLINEEVALYREGHRDKSAAMIADWPSQTRLRGWFVRLVREGHQVTHNHTDAWLSGCVYLQIPQGFDGDQGAIEFRLEGPRYPGMGKKSKSLLHKPQAGDLALFPSSLFHRTIPFDSDEERLCIAFDVVPV